MTAYSTNIAKKEQIKEMFNKISRKYDITNSILSLGIHHYWRKKCVEVLKPYHPKNILDLATGTADLAIALSKLTPKKIIAADYAEKMLELANQKINRNKLNYLIEVKKEDGENLSFENSVFDAVTISFGIRNFENYAKGISEMYRVLKPNGILLILEFTYPKNIMNKKIYQLYFQFILPIVACISTGNKRAYDYLPSSVSTFPQYENFCNLIQAQGFSYCQYIPLTGGIATMYIARK